MLLHTIGGVYVASANRHLGKGSLAKHASGTGAHWKQKRTLALPLPPPLALPLALPLPLTRCLLEAEAAHVRYAFHRCQEHA